MASVPFGKKCGLLCFKILFVSLKVLDFNFLNLLLVFVRGVLSLGRRSLVKCSFLANGALLKL